MDVDARALRPSLASLELLAELRLEGACFHGVSVELRELARFCGLERALGLELERQAEAREEALGVEKEGHLPDPPLP